MKKIIVTGGCGYIGSHTVVALIEEGYEVVVFDDLSNSQEFIIGRIQEITNVLPLLEKFDLTNPELAKHFYKKHADAVAIIHFAAYKAVGESVKEPLKYYRNNIFSLINTLEAQKENEISNIIFSSSATVYGEPDSLPITENNLVKQPFSPYGNTKKIAEEVLQDFTQANDQYSVISLRYFNPIGAHKSGKIGELPTGTPNNLLPYITQCAAGVLKELQVFGDDYPTRDGTAIRDYIHVEDLAVAHVKAVNRLVNKQQEAPYEVFNLGTGNGFTVMEVIKAFEKVAQMPLNYRIVARRAGDVPKLYASTEKAKEKLNWTTQYSLEDMISSSWSWEQELRKTSNLG